MTDKKITLTEEQKRAVNMPTGKPTLIKGVAGSGKSTIALYRASKLLRPDQVEDNMSLGLDEPTSINGAIFTFNKQLIAYLEEQIDAQGLDEEIELTNYHKWAYHMAVKYNLTYTKNGQKRRLRVITGKEQNPIIEAAIKKVKVNSESSVLSKPTEFFKDEISWIKGQNIKSFESYLAIKRVGRGTKIRLDESSRTAVWEVYECYESEKLESGYDFDDFALLVKKKQQLGQLKDKYDFLIIDEVQDLTKVQIETLIESVKEVNGERAITFVGDVAQRIYKSNFSWSSVGVEIRGRSRELRDNYRNTREIYEAALQLVKGIKTEEDTDIRYLPHSGRAPFVRGFENKSQEFFFVMKCISRILEGSSDSSIAVLAQSNEIVEQFQMFWDENHEAFGLSNRHISNLKILTMHAAKGLEFDVVFLVDLNKEFYEEQAEDEEDEEQVILKRKLLYVAMTRAKKDLMITYTGELTPLLSFLEK